MMQELKSICAGMGMAEEPLQEFLRLFEKFKTGPSRIEQWETLKSPDEDLLADYQRLPLPDSASAVKNLARLVVLKLNGGLGTSMGCEGPKSCIVAKNGKTFLDLIFDQARSLNRRERVPLALMNSFYTHEETLNAVRNPGKGIDLATFLQNRFPRLDAATLLPAFSDPADADTWYPPGHGDLFGCLSQQGFLDRWLEEGREILFASNSDNLGAMVDERILHLMLEKDIPFLMELTPKTPVDIKGGTVYQSEGKLHLLEIGNVPDEHLDDFQGMGKFKVFNTNNIWINLKHLKIRVEQGPLDLGVVVNEKEVRGRKVLQLETAMGAGLDNFEQSMGLVVPRTRFAPVKNTSDLLRIRSNIYLEEDGMLVPNPGRQRLTVPEIRLTGPLEKVDELDRRIPVTPGMADLESLEIKGNVFFKGKVELVGNVILEAVEGPLELGEGAVLDNEKISR